MNLTKAALKTRLYLLAGWILVTSAPFLVPLAAFVRTSVAQDDASYVLVVPFLSVGVVLLERRRIFADLSTDKLWGAGFLLAGGFAAIASYFVAAPDRLPVSVLSLVLFWIAGFAFLFGRSAIKASSFALLFLLLMIPPPNPLLDRVTYLLQIGSAWLTQVFFNLFGVIR